MDLVTLVNNRWKNLHEINSESEIDKIAEELGVEVNRTVFKKRRRVDPDTNEEVEDSIPSIIRKGRATLFEEIQEAMTYRIDIPRELWTEAQEQLIDEQNLLAEKDGKEEGRNREKARIRIVLQDIYRLPLEQAKYVDERLNYTKVAKHKDTYNRDGKLVKTLIGWDRVRRDRPIVTIDEKNKAKSNGKESLHLVSSPIPTADQAETLDELDSVLNKEFGGQSEGGAMGRSEFDLSVTTTSQKVDGASTSIDEDL